MNDKSRILCSYTRTQALANGLLVDITELAQRAGYRHPVAFTQAVFERYVRAPKGISEDQATGRLWDILLSLRASIQENLGYSTITFFALVRHESRLVSLKAVSGPRDDGEPVLTVMLPEED